MPYATYRFNKIIAAETIRFIVTVAIVVYKGLKLVVYRMLTKRKREYKENGGKLHVGKATSRRSLLLEEYVIKTCGIFFFYLCQTVFTRIKITWNIESLVLRVA